MSNNKIAFRDSFSSIVGYCSLCFQLSGYRVCHPAFIYPFDMSNHTGCIQLIQYAFHATFGLCRFVRNLLHISRNLTECFMIFCQYNVQQISLF